MTELKKVFITGASGCVGHYLIDEFLKEPQYQLILLLRDKSKLKKIFPKNSEVTIVESALEDFEKYADYLKNVDYLVHSATSWGGSFEVNYALPLKIFEFALSYRCQKVINFSTASILNEDNKILEEARQFGTEYIKSKLKLYEEIKKSAYSEKIINVFPTLILGGDETHPYSYISQSVPLIKKWFWLIRFLKIDAGFHFIHAKDVAKIVRYLIEHKTEKNDYVLGYPYLTAEQLIKEFAKILGKKIYFQVKLPINLIIKIAPFLGVTFLPWDIYCLKHHRHFRYQTTQPKDFGISQFFNEGEFSYLFD